MTDNPDDWPVIKVMVRQRTAGGDKQLRRLNGGNHQEEREGEKGNEEVVRHFF